MDGRELRTVPLLQRKRPLKRILPREESRLRYVDHLVARGRDLFRLACEQDLVGIVGKWSRGTYQHGPGTSWLKIKNPAYSQMEGRHELFERRSPKSRAPFKRRTLLLA